MHTTPHLDFAPFHWAPPLMRTASVQNIVESAVQTAGSAAACDTLDALYVINCLGIGGSEKKVVRLVNRLCARGVRAGVAYLNGPDTLAGMLHPDVPRWHLERKGKFSLTAVRRLQRIVDETRCRTLFTVNMYPTLYASAVSTLLGSRAPKLVALVNTTDFGSGNRWRQHLYRRVLERFNTIVYGCNVQRRAWLDQQDPAWSRSAIIYNGVDLHEFNAHVPASAVEELRERLGWPTGAFIFGGVGRLVPSKNQAVLIDTLAHVRRAGVDARLLIVGEGELRKALESRAATAGMADAVALTGALADPKPALALMDVFVLPSLFVETFSNAALEAMAMGKAVVLSDVGGAKEMIRDGIDGRVLPRDALAKELPNVLMELANDRAQIARFGAAARQRVAEQFSFDTMVSQYERLIERHDDGNART